MDYYKFFYWDFPNFLKSIKCFWVGHDERMGCEEDYETSYCARCNIGWPQDIYT